MAKLYPPIINGTLPAFYSEIVGANREIKITIPFTMNRAVSPIQVKGFALRIKTVQNSTYLYTAQVKQSEHFVMEGSPWVTFILNSSNNSMERDLLLRSLKVGLFYKFQLAYINQNDEIGHFSSVGIGKFTTKPIVRIENLNSSMSNIHHYNYTGIYEQQDGDFTEKVYTYQFNIYDNKDNIIATSGEQIHNATNDTELNFSYDIYNYYQDLSENDIYKIQYSVITNNGLSVSSPRYRIIRRETIEPDIVASLIATSNFDDGYITVKLKGQKNSKGEEMTANGAFILSRSDEESNFTKWEEVFRFKIMEKKPSEVLDWKDFTAIQGRKYKYAIHQYNNNYLYSNKIISNTVLSDFEDTFLYDGERQLKIKYNPKIGNIKTNISEQKTDTLGSKYPFFFRNGNVNYKEFTISGLISYFMDNESFFLSKDEFFVDEYTTNHTSNNLANERIFKLKVLEWLNNGQPKLYRSPGEGNYIVRLMKVTLNPENKLGRMLHSFNGTAYEIKEYNYENLGTYNFLHLVKEEDMKYQFWKTVNFSDKDSNGNNIYKLGQNLLDYPTYNISLSDMRPGQLVHLIFEGGRKETIMIGITGAYKTKSAIPIISIILDNTNLKYQDEIEDIYLNGSMIYNYYTTWNNKFKLISNIQVEDVISSQFIGTNPQQDILKSMDHIYYNGEWIKNPKIEVLKFYNLKSWKRTIEDVVKQGENYYKDQEQNPLLKQNTNDFILYRIGEYLDTGILYKPDQINYKFEPRGYQDFCNNISYSLENYDSSVYINGEKINLDLIDKIELKDNNIPLSLSNGNGVVTEISYQIKITDFNIEDNSYYPVYIKKREYLSLIDKFKRYLEIAGFLGNYETTKTFIEQELQITADTLWDDYYAEDVNNYETQKNNLSNAYENLYRETLDTEGKIGISYEEYLNRIQDYQEALENETNEDKKYQLRQAINIEKYEYIQQKNSSYVALQKILSEIDVKIESLRDTYNEDYSLLTEQYEIQLEDLEIQKEALIEEAAELFEVTPEQSSNLDLLYINIELPLRESINTAYINYILSLIESQRLAALLEEESYD